MKPKYLWFFAFAALVLALFPVYSYGDLSVSVPLSKSATAGTPVEYTLSVVNNGVVGDSFTVDVSNLPPGFSGAVYPSSFTLEPGMSQAVSVFITSPGGMPAGNYGIGLSVVSASSGTSSRTFTYSIVASAGMGTTTTTLSPNDCTAQCINPSNPHWWYGGRPGRRVGSMFNTTSGRLYPIWGECWPFSRFYSSSPWPVGLLFDDNSMVTGNNWPPKFTPCTSSQNDPHFCGCGFTATCDRQCFYFKPGSHTGACRETCQPCESELGEASYGCAAGTSGRCCCEMQGQPSLEVDLTTAYHIKYPTATSPPLLCDNLVCKAILVIPANLIFQVLTYNMTWNGVSVSSGGALCEPIGSDSSFNFYKCRSPEWSILSRSDTLPGDSFACTMSLYLGPPDEQPPCLVRSDSLTIAACPESKEDIWCKGGACDKPHDVENDFVEVCHRDIIKWLCRELNFASNYPLRESVFVDHKFDSAAMIINAKVREEMPFDDNEPGGDVCYQNTKAHHLANGASGVCRHFTGFFISAIKTIGGSAHQFGFCNMRDLVWCHSVAMYKSDDGSYWVMDEGLTAKNKEEWSQETETNCIDNVSRCNAGGDDAGYCPNTMPCTQTCCPVNPAVNHYYLYPSNTCVPWDPPRYCKNAPTIVPDCTKCGCPQNLPPSCPVQCDTAAGTCYSILADCTSTNTTLPAPPEPPPG